MAKVRRIKKTNDPNLFQGKHRSVWNFWKDGVSSLILATILTSLEEARLALVEGYATRGEPIYFAFGTCIHWMLEKIYEKNVKPSSQKIKELLKQYNKAWLRDCMRPTTFQLQQQELVQGMAAVVLPAYCDRWAGDFKRGKYPIPNKTAHPHNWAELETRFRVPYTFPDGKQTWLNGTRDALFLTKSDKFWGFDHKCYKIIVPRDIIDTMMVDPQLMFYLNSLHIEGTWIPKGIIKNIIRRPGQIRGQRETLKDYLARMAKDIQNPAKWDHYFQRYELEISGREVAAWRARWLDPLMLDVRLWWEGKRPSYPNPLTLLTKYGRSRMFDPIVYENMDMLYRRTSVMDYQSKLA